MDRQEILSKYENEDDRLFIAKFLDKLELSQKRNDIETTDFLDMHQSSLVKKLIKTNEYRRCVIYGGYEGAERECVIIYPEKLEMLFVNEKFDFNCMFQIIRITLSDELIGKYTHKIYLGAIIKVGVKREKIGDILVRMNGADIIVKKEISEYLCNNLCGLNRFEKCYISIERVEDLKVTPVKKQTSTIIISSMRADSIVSEMVKTSRSKILEIIKQERVFVNGELLTKNSKSLREGDSITVRGKGRYKINKVVNTTKKGNLVLEIEKYI